MCLCSRVNKVDDGHTQVAMFYALTSDIYLIAFTHKHAHTQILKSTVCLIPHYTLQRGWPCKTLNEMS